ncbi:MAG: flagellar basal body-associated FliL family protein [Gammaproteobacteria bacterium]|nr:flagellar basal body-associated FliL family protein [Gammaproteobacteria bacterium]
MADKQEPEAAPESRGSKKNLILIILGAVLLIGASAGGTFFLIGGDSQVAETQATDEEAAKPPREPRYLDLDPPFTVNLEGSSSLLRISISLLVYGNDVESVVTEHMPQIRNSLVLLFSNQDAASVKDRSGKDKLRQNTLETIREIVSQYTEIDEMEVFFTGFVMQ